MTSRLQTLAQRSRILSRPDDGQTSKEISELLQISAPVVAKWFKFYRDAVLEGLNELANSGKPNPPENALVLSFEDGMQIPAMGCPQSMLPLKTGRIDD